MPMSESLPFPPPWPWKVVGRALVLDDARMDRLSCPECGTRRLVPAGHRPATCSSCAWGPPDPTEGPAALDASPEDASPLVVEVARV